jgi:C4-dicarboxylate-binding protein DctP
MVVVNAKWWNGLPADIKKGLTEAMNEATVYNNKISQEKNDEARKAIVDSGKTKIKILTDAQLAEWKKAVAPVYAQFENDIGADLIKAAQSHSTKKK